MLDEFVNVIYCKDCKVILIDYQERMIEYSLYYRYWTESGELVNGESECLDGHPDGAHYPICTICRKETPYYLKLEKEVFMLILKSCYRHSKEKSYFNRDVDTGFKIELKHEEEPDSLLMIAPTLQEVKEAITENNI